MQNAILSAKDLIAKKVLIEKKKSKIHEIEVEDLGILKFRTPTTYDIMDSIEFKDGGSEDDFIVYMCSVEPNLKSSELQEAFECKEPFEIVDKLFLPGEKQRIAKLLTEVAGYKEDSAKLVRELKNE